MTRDLVVFGEDWNSLPSSTQHLIKHISISRKVVWINSIGLRKPKFTIKDLSRMVMKISCVLTRFIKKNRCDIDRSKRINKTNIYVYTLLSIPAPKYRWERFIVKKLLASQIHPLINRHLLKNVAIWTSLPTVSDLIDEFPGIPYIYYCCDDFSALAGVDHLTAAFHEKKIAEKSDLIVVSSKNLVQRFPHQKCYHLPHGVDLELFACPTARANDLPENGKPTAGFYGSIAAWVDLELLQDVIARTPDWNFVFIGNTQIDVSVIKKLKNAFFLGPKEHSELPRYSQHWQVSLLPFKDNAQIHACNPLKLKEYLAAGPPIISTPFPAASHYEKQISIVRNSLEMCQSLKEIMLGHSLKNKSKRRAAVENESWSAKAEQLEVWIDAL